MKETNYETNYADFTKITDGTRFRVVNGNWYGYVFSKNNTKFIHVEKTGHDIEVTGKEDLIIEVL